MEIRRVGQSSIAIITSPSDERLLTKSNEIPQDTLKIRAKFWGELKTVEAIAHWVNSSQVWEVEVSIPREGTHALKVSFKDAGGKLASHESRLAVGQHVERKSEERDQDNALEAWPEHGLLGTQLGPNKNGKKW